MNSFNCILTIRQNSTSHVRRKRIRLTHEDYEKLILKLNKKENGFTLLDVEKVDSESETHERE
jgi:hypothetical protein